MLNLLEQACFTSGRRQKKPFWNANRGSGTWVVGSVSFAELGRRGLGPLERNSAIHEQDCRVVEELQHTLMCCVYALACFSDAILRDHAVLCIQRRVLTT